MKVQGLGFRIQVCLPVVIAVILAGCGRGPQQAEEAAGSKALSVYVVNYPLKYFAERIGGEWVEVQFPAPADEDPAFWKPSVEVITAYQQADLILLNGAGYAKWVSKVSLPSARMIDTGEALAADRLIELEDHATHIHGPEGVHAHEGWAFTTWLDPELAVEQARAIKDALSQALPDRTLEFSERFAELSKDLMAIDAQYKLIFATDPGRPLVFSHPVYQYFERRYALNGRSVHWEPDAVPSEKMWADLKVLLKEHPAKWMVWEGKPLPETVAALKRLGVDSVTVAPCGSAPDSGDFLVVMQQGIAQLLSAYGSPGKP